MQLLQAGCPEIRNEVEQLLSILLQLLLFMPLLCYIVKLFYIPQILVVWWHTSSQIGAFAAD
jgi:hypothetical protein